MEKKRKPIRLRRDKNLLYWAFRQFTFTACPEDDTDQCAKCAFEEKKHTGFCEYIPCIAAERPDSRDGYFTEELINNNNH